MTKNHALPAASLASIARASLEDAKRLLRHAQTAKAQGQHATAGGMLSRVRAIIANARAMYAAAMQRMARAEQLAHKYTRNGTRWRAVVAITGTSLTHTLARSYGKRQSAQRAALNTIAALVAHA